MLQKTIEKLGNYPYLAESFLIISSILLFLTFIFLKYKSVVRFSINKFLGNSIVFIFSMTVVIYFYEIVFISNYSQLSNMDSLKQPVLFENTLNIFIRFLICLFLAAFFFTIVVRAEKNQKLQSELLLLLYFSAVGLPLLCIANDLLNFYLIIELVLLFVFSLAVYRKDSSCFLNADLKYFVMRYIYFVFFVVGSVLTYVNNSSFCFLELHNFLSFIDLEHSANYIFVSDADFGEKFSLKKNIEDYTWVLSSQKIPENSFDGAKTLAHSVSASSEKATFNTPACSCPPLSEIQKKYFPEYVAKDNAVSIKDKIACDKAFELFYDIKHPLELLDLNEHQNMHCKTCKQLESLVSDLHYKSFKSLIDPNSEYSISLRNKFSKLFQECVVECKKCEDYKTHINKLNKEICEKWCMEREIAYKKYFFENYIKHNFYFNIGNKSQKP